ncbi:MAG: RNA-binding domain-containing protein [Halobacteriota archaeon]
MNEKELIELIEKGEDSFTEFKEEKAHSNDLAAEIVAFSNTEGGKILLGISDNKEIKGVTNPDKEMLRVENISRNNCEPPLTVNIEKIKINKGIVLCIYIPKGPERPYRTNRGVYYIRSSSGKRQATREELLRLYQATRSIHYDELPVPATSIDELDIRYFRRFFERFYQTRIDESLDLNKLLENMKIFTRQDKKLVFTVGGYLLFGLNPQKELPVCKITIAKFGGNKIGEEFEKKDLEGNLEEQIKAADTVLNLYLKTRVNIKGFENELQPEIPKEVLREVVVNAVAHRDYHITSQIRIFIFDNRLEIMSPGKLPNGITLENIKLGVHSERNPLIVSYLAKMGYMTQIGTGIVRMTRLLKEHTGKEPEFEERGQEFVVRIWRVDE